MLPLPDPLPVPGIRLGSTCAEIKYAGRRDLVLVEAAPGTTAAAVFTRNAFCAAPVSVAKHHLSLAAPRYLVINTGYANAGTGTLGVEDAQATCATLAEIAHCRNEEVLPFSTGVIGEPLPLERVQRALPDAYAALTPKGWLAAAEGIMTTDTRPKVTSQQVVIEGHTVTLTGMAKGAGMIKPDMATMLAFVATDAGLAQPLLQGCLKGVVAESFNAITVDGDTSTNDACVVLATGQSAVYMDTEGPAYRAFQEALQTLCTTLAQALIRDGEGATKFLTVTVEQGSSLAECRQVAYTIAHSPLVKTAFFASDPNWGRILAAVGRADIEGLSLEAVSIYLDDVCIVRHGALAAEYTEARGQFVMAQEEITVRVMLGRGNAAARIWTTDLSYEYVRINADYRT
jgi:glutamate N-acetyltransferase/amino-acid N-acetyltransferase